jgi:hypothetical protein
VDDRLGKKESLGYVGPVLRSMYLGRCAELGNFRCRNKHYCRTVAQVGIQRVIASRGTPDSAARRDPGSRYGTAGPGVIGLMHVSPIATAFDIDFQQALDRLSVTSMFFGILAQEAVPHKIGRQKTPLIFQG